MDLHSDDTRRLAWSEWQARNRRQEIRGEEQRTRWTRYGSIAVLLVTAALWVWVADYHLGVRFAVAAGAVSTAIAALVAGKPLWSACFWGLALLYNPVYPTFEMAGLPALFIVLATAIPFAAALRNSRANPVAEPRVAQ